MLPPCWPSLCLVPTSAQYLLQLPAWEYTGSSGLDSPTSFSKMINDIKCVDYMVNEGYYPTEETLKTKLHNLQVRIQLITN